MPKKESKTLQKNEKISITTTLEVLADSFSILMDILYSKIPESMKTLNVRTNFLLDIISAMSTYTSFELEEMGVFDPLLSILCTYIGIEKNTRSILDYELPAMGDFNVLGNSNNRAHKDVRDLPNVNLCLNNLIIKQKDCFPRAKYSVNRIPAEIASMISALSSGKSNGVKNSHILVSPPGGGKTTILKEIKRSTSSVISVIELSSTTIQSSITGQSERNVQFVIDQIRAYKKPIIVIIDEADSLLGSRDMVGESAAGITRKNIVTGFQVGMDRLIDEECPVCFILATNYLHKIERAIVDRSIVHNLPAPTTNEKMEILKLHMRPIVEEIFDHTGLDVDAETEDFLSEKVAEMNSCGSFREINELSAKYCNEYRNKFNLNYLSRYRVSGCSDDPSDSNVVFACGIRRPI